jgi:hypothetical protein
MLVRHYSLEHWRPIELGDIIHDGHMEVFCLLHRMNHFGGVSLGILEEVFEPYMACEHLVTCMEACT